MLHGSQDLQMPLTPVYGLGGLGFRSWGSGFRLPIRFRVYLDPEEPTF